MNLVGQFFFSLFFLYFSFGLAMQIISVLNKSKKGLIYMFLSFLAMAFMFLGASMLLFYNNVLVPLYITGPLRVVVLPLLFLFFKKMNTQNKSFQKDDIVHFIPFVFEIIFTFSLVTYLRTILPPPGHIEFSTLLNVKWDDHFYYNLMAITARSIALVQAFVYAVLITKIYKRYKTEFLHQNSSISYFNLRWISWVKYILLLNGIISGAELFGLYTNHFFIVFSAGFLVFNAFFFLIHTVLHKDFIADDLTISPPSVLISQNGIEPIIKQNILVLFRDNNIFLNPDLCLQEAANQLSVSKYKLSTCIKSDGYDNFFHFVNQLRINRSKDLLMNLSPNQCIDSVVKDSGFKSRATFYRVFKEYCGVTPTQYIETLNRPQYQD